MLMREGVMFHKAYEVTTSLLHLRWLFSLILIWFLLWASVEVITDEDTGVKWLNEVSSNNKNFKFSKVIREGCLIFITNRASKERHGWFFF